MNDDIQYKKEKNLIASWRDSTGLSTTKLSELTGIPGSYIILLEADGIKKPSRDNLIAIALGLNKNLHEINQLLKYYELEELRTNAIDIGSFVKAAERKSCGNSSFGRYGINLLASVYALDLATEQSEVILASSKPYSALFSQESLKILFKTSRAYKSSAEEDDNLRKVISLNIHEERHRLFRKKIQTTKFINLLCEDCLKSFVNDIKRDTSITGKEKAAFFDEFIDTIRTTMYSVLLTTQCCNYEFYLSEYIKSKDKSVPITLFLPRQRPTTQSENKEHNINPDNQIGVIITESKDMHSMFTVEYNTITSKTETTDKLKTIQKLQEIIPKKWN